MDDGFTIIGGEDGHKSLVERAKKVADLPDDLFEVEVETWGNGGRCTGGMLLVGSAMTKPGSDERTVCLSVDVNTWGFGARKALAQATLMAYKELGHDAVPPMIPSVHLTKDQWEQVKAAGDRVFG